ncbi:MAG: hypothetical protein AAFM91_16265 [Pseudomonadota bacterium]
MLLKSTSSASAVAIDGIRRGQRDLTRAASEVANGDTGDNARQTTRGLLDAQQAARQIEASARALERVNQAVGSLIDTLA